MWPKGKSRSSENEKRMKRNEDGDGYKWTCMVEP